MPFVKPSCSLSGPRGISLPSFIPRVKSIQGYHSGAKEDGEKRPLLSCWELWWPETGVAGVTERSGLSLITQEWWAGRFAQTLLAGYFPDEPAVGISWQSHIPQMLLHLIFLADGSITCTGYKLPVREHATCNSLLLFFIVCPQISQGWNPERQTFDTRFYLLYFQFLIFFFNPQSALTESGF